MKLNSISLANFRGLEYVEFPFEKDVNIIAGENGIGKSSILCALATLLSHAIRKITPARIGELKFSNADVRFGSESLLVSAKFEVDGKVLDLSVRRSLENSRKTASLIKELEERLSDSRNIEGHIKRNREKEQAKIKRDIAALRKTLAEGEDMPAYLIDGLDSPATAEDSRLVKMTENAFFESLRKRTAQPIAVYYTTKRFFNDAFKTFPRSPPFSLQRAYSNALENLDVSLKDFAYWFHFASQNEKGVRIANRMVEVISEFIEEFRNLRLSPDAPPRFLVDKGGATLELKQLSDGERGLLAMVFDLTRRLSLANPKSDDPIAEGEAIVLIDEIELHLHPRWQRLVLHRLASTFKNCQFIATTHSPQVLGEVEARGIRFLERDEESGKVDRWQPTEALGLDSNRILDELMGVPERNTDVSESLAEVFRLIDDDQFEKARESIQPLAKKLGANEPELTRAQALIKFLECTE